jgi:hypothetical protein
VSRSVPRPFNYAWGNGQIVEEASAPNDYYEPAIQLLRCEGGEYDGKEHVRFCFYSSRGGFQRSPMVVGNDDMAGLREALEKTPRLREALRQLLAD